MLPTVHFPALPAHVPVIRGRAAFHQRDQSTACRRKRISFDDNRLLTASIGSQDICPTAPAPGIKNKPSAPVARVIEPQLTSSAQDSAEIQAVAPAQDRPENQAAPSAQLAQRSLFQPLQRQSTMAISAVMNAADSRQKKKPRLESASQGEPQTPLYSAKPTPTAYMNIPHSVFSESCAQAPTKDHPAIQSREVREAEKDIGRKGGNAGDREQERVVPHEASKEADASVQGTPRPVKKKAVTRKKRVSVGVQTEREDHVLPASTAVHASSAGSSQDTGSAADWLAHLLSQADFSAFLSLPDAELFQLMAHLRDASPTFRALVCHIFRGAHRQVLTRLFLQCYRISAILSGSIGDA